MKIVILHGQSHKGSTYHITMELVEKLNASREEVSEFYFTEQKHCLGCFNCIMKGEEYCPHYDQVKGVVQAINEADVIIMESPCYCLGVSGQLKSFLDHLSFMWVTHRPDERMLSKIGIVISTTAGAGCKRVTKYLASNLFYWGVPKTYQLPMAVAAGSWDEVSEKRKERIAKMTDQIAQKVKKHLGKAKPNLKFKVMFYLMRKMHQGSEWSQADGRYWHDAGWIEDKRPWKVC